MTWRALTDKIPFLVRAPRQAAASSSFSRGQNLVSQYHQDSCLAPDDGPTSFPTTSHGHRTGVGIPEPPPAPRPLSPLTFTRRRGPGCGTPRGPGPWRRAGGTPPLPSARGGLGLGLLRPAPVPCIGGGRGALLFPQLKTCLGGAAPFPSGGPLLGGRRAVPVGRRGPPDGNGAARGAACGAWLSHSSERDR